MEKRDVIIIILLSAILLGVVAILINNYNNNADKDKFEASILQKIQQSNLTNQQKQELINIVQETIEQDEEIQDLIPGEGGCPAGQKPVTVCTTNLNPECQTNCMPISNSEQTCSPCGGRCVSNLNIETEACPASTGGFKCQIVNGICTKILNNNPPTQPKACTSDSECASGERCLDCSGMVRYQNGSPVYPEGSQKFCIAGVC